MKEEEIIEIFFKFIPAQKCPLCGKALTGGYYDPEAIVKGPSDGVLPIKVPIGFVLNEKDRYSDTLTLFVECSRYGRGCGFIAPFHRFYREIKNLEKKRDASILL